MVRKNDAAGVAACVGAVIGAGFASGREVVAFFTRYGVHSWWLILLSAAAMMLLCALCMREAYRRKAGSWCRLYAGLPRWMRVGAQACATMMLAVTGGAMISASGHLIQLLWASDWAYPIGAVGTLMAAWIIGHGSLRPLSWISGALTAVFLGAILAALARNGNAQTAVPLAGEADSLVWAAVRAVAYAAMNLTLAIGVVCRHACRSVRRARRLSVGFGWTLVALLFVSNYLYGRHPELFGEAFPIVRLLLQFGRGGYVASVILLYMAVFTSLVAVLYALGGVVEGHARGAYLRAALTLGPPLLVSCVGFEGIVDGLYAPAGLMCLALVFGPLMYRRFAGKLPLDNPPVIK